MVLMMVCLAAQALVSSAVFVGCFWRLVATNDTTIKTVRLSIWAQASTASAIFFAPYLPFFDHSIGWEPLTTPTWIWIAGLGSTAWVDYSKKKYWGQGVPLAFVKPEHRRSTDFTHRMV